MEMFNCKSVCVRVDALLKTLSPAIQEICLQDLELPADQQNAIFHQLYKNLIKGASLIKESENISPFNLPLNYRYASRLLELEKAINDFMGLMPAHILLHMRRLMGDLESVYYPQDIQCLDTRSMLKESILRQASMLTNDPCRNTMMLQQMGSANLIDCTEMVKDSTYSYHDNVPGKSQFNVGMKKSITELKGILFHREVSLVGLQCIGGGGKTTLALALCNDSEIKDYFENKVLFITVSQCPNLKGILETMWEKLFEKKKPEFQNVEDGHRQVQQQLLKKEKPILVILDDVWSRSSLDKLLFEGREYKTLITTRDISIIPKNPCTKLYQLPLLGQGDALSLFCFWAFGQTSIPGTADANLVKEVQAECGGLPLALKVIGSTLHGEPRVAWERAKSRLSKGESISDYHREGLLECLATSIDFLDDRATECFLDLGSFPEDKKICADALLDIWVNVRKLDWQDAFVILLELASRNLLNLISNPRNQAAISYGNASELYFFQHDVIRDLALYLGFRDSAVHSKRLFMPRKESSLPQKWKLHTNKTFEAQILSIHTGPMNETQWDEMIFPEAEVMVIVFAASEYFLPPYLKSMKKLKILMVFNYGSKRATLKGMDALSSLTQLKVLRLERLIATPIEIQNKGVQNIEKLSLSLCEGFESTSTLNSTKLQDFNLDHCSDLEVLPPGICNMQSVQMLSVTNCHLIQNLPSDLGSMIYLRVLRLSALPGLTELPSSIGNLVWLEYLDISVCEGLKKLPEEIGKLGKLSELDMRECSRLRKLPRTVCGLGSLKRVVCDEEIGKQWFRAKRFSIPELEVEIVEAEFNLDWLLD
ncbi:putative disease resistance protein At5g47280 [Cryptomeria japonica]|uniref:putative disease resistance protein At5g47280 n=1 Tax=Cryptomeria japonica TaxID=3369 RepID=UPI0027D9D9D8|nr:putative disease resistance protein At5g47280 [Cryptomeria japonica]